jgi:hypothetical protein
MNGTEKMRQRMRDTEGIQRAPGTNRLQTNEKEKQH